MKPESNLSTGSDPDIESLETQWQSSPDLSTSNWNCNDLLLYRDLTVENSFDNLDFGNSFSQPHAPQPGCPPNNFDQSDVPLPTFDPLDMARIDVTQRAYNSIAVPDMECYGSKDSINPLRIFLDRPCIQVRILFRKCRKHTTTIFDMSYVSSVLIRVGFRISSWMHNRNCQHSSCLGNNLLAINEKIPVTLRKTIATSTSM